MLKETLEKNILLKNVDIFKKNVKLATNNLLLKILPFICACGNLQMYSFVENIIYNFPDVPNKDMLIRMSLISENYEIASYLLPKNYMSQSNCLRYYVCSGGNDIRIYNMLNTVENWEAIIDTDIKHGIKNGNLFTIKYILSKKTLPLDNYNYLPYDKHSLILNDELILYYKQNNINIEFLLEELYNRKIKNLEFINHIYYLKKFTKLVRYKI
jgi:hypothetical protein